MLSSFLILLREGLEAALIVAIVCAYLTQIRRQDLFRPVWVGAGTAIVVSLAAGAGLFLTVGALEGRAEEIIEGSVMLVAVAVLTWMIFWMGRQGRRVKSQLQERVDGAIAAGSAIGVGLVVFIGVVREGFETALFFIATAAGASAASALLGGALGLAGAVALGYLVFRGSSKLNLQQFFAVSGGLLLVIAAGLLSRGIHGFQEAGVLVAGSAQAYDISALISAESLFGEVLGDLLGFSPTPTIAQTLAWVFYVGAVGGLYLRQLSPGPDSRPAETSGAGRAE